MSIEISLYPKSASKKELREHLRSLGFQKTGHLWDWPQGSTHFFWFESEDYKSINGVEATIYPPSEEEQQRYGSCEWALHTRTRAGASSFDREQQNNVIRSARRRFGGNFYNDWYGKNRYIEVDKDEKGPVGRGIFLSYETVQSNIGSVRFALPQPTFQLNVESNLSEELERMDPARVLYNALVPFAVASLEHFFGQSFKILLHYDSNGQERLRNQNRKVEMRDVIAISSGEKSVEDVVASWYSFQNVRSISSAYNEWLGINLWEVFRRRRKVGRKFALLEQEFDNLINFRHGVIHRLELDFDLSRSQIEDILDVTLALMDAFVDYLEEEKGFKIRDPHLV